jgi:hypothetical protein
MDFRVEMNTDWAYQPKANPIRIWRFFRVHNIVNVAADFLNREILITLPISVEL